MTTFASDPEGARRRLEAARMRCLLARQIASYVGDNQERQTPVEGLSLAVVTATTAPMIYLYPPSLSLIIRGRKRVQMGEETYHYDASRFLLTAINLPTVTEVLDASAQNPYIALRLRLDTPAAHAFIAETSMAEIEQLPGSSMATGEVSAEILDAVGRLIGLLEKPQHLRHLCPLIQQEILYRILTSSAGARFRQTMTAGTQSHKVAKAVAWIWQNYAQVLRVEALAAHAGMGVSTLHHHFREMTTMSPLQYQKHLRLHEARRILIAERTDAASAAMRVGYESVPQFNREYRRMFGAPPIRNVTSLRKQRPQSDAAAN